MKYLMSLVVVLIAGCTKTPVCDIAKSLKPSLAQTVATQLDCKNQEAIMATIQAQLETAKVCDSAGSAKSPVGDFVCGPVVDGLLTAASSQIPKEWECTGGPGKELAKAKLLEVCQKAL